MPISHRDSDGPTRAAPRKKKGGFATADLKVTENLEFLASFLEALQTAGFTREETKQIGEDPRLLLTFLEIVRADLDRPDADTMDDTTLEQHPTDVPAFLTRGAYGKPKKGPKFS
jgi:hypothetical protein